MQHIVIGITLFIIFGIPSLINHLFIYIKYKKLPMVYYIGKKDINTLDVIFISFNIVAYSVILSSIVSSLICYLAIFIGKILCNI